MECHDVRVLLAFSQRPIEKLDAREKDAVAQHLHACPDCAALADAESRADQALSRAMCDVPVPAELKQSVLKRLAARPQGKPWKWVAIAAGLLVALSASLAWHHFSRPLFTQDDVLELAMQPGWEPEQIKQFLTDHGLPIVIPDDFDYRYFQHVDVVEFKGQRVAKLAFSRTENDGTVIADVLVLSHDQFRMEELPTSVRGSTSVQIQQKDGFSFIILYRGGLLERLKPVRF